MEIAKKLQLIQEGFSIGEINSGAKSFTELVTEAAGDEFSLFIESVSTDINFMADLTIGSLTESDGAAQSKGFLATVAKLFQWIADKIAQFVKFVKSKFTGGTTKTRTDKVEEKVKEQVAIIESPKFKATVGKSVTDYEVETYTNVYDKDNVDFLANWFRKSLQHS